MVSSLAGVNMLSSIIAYSRPVAGTPFWYWCHGRDKKIRKNLPGGFSGSSIRTKRLDRPPCTVKKHDGECGSKGGKSATTDKIHIARNCPELERLKHFFDAVGFREIEKGLEHINMKHITDFHTHAFADRIYERAMQSLKEGSGIEPFHNGSIAGLMASMDQAGIWRSVVLSIATKPEHADVILDWSLLIASERIIPFGSVMPTDRNAARDVRRMAGAGIKGIKIHPYYQNFYMDDTAMDPFYEAVAESGLILVSHTGYDVAYPGRDDLATPERTARVIARHPDLCLVAAHFGGWEDWDAVEKHLLGKPVWLETSFLTGVCDRERARRMFLSHDPARLVFGSDSPWVGQAEEIQRVEGLDLPPDLLEAVMEKNAQALLDAAVHRA